MSKTKIENLIVFRDPDTAEIIKIVDRKQENRPVSTRLYFKLLAEREADRV